MATATQRSDGDRRFRPARSTSRTTMAPSITVATFVTRLALASLLALPCNAQAPDVRAAIESAATALGMVRGTARRMDSINTIEFSGRGTLSAPSASGQRMRFEITEATVGISYSLPAMRWDMTRRNASGDQQRTIQVVRGERAWDERLPGVDPTEIEGQASRRLHQIWLTPHGVITAAVRDPSSVTLGSAGGRTTLTVDISGGPVTATLDSDSRPASVEMMIDHPELGRTKLEAAYANYVDWPLLDVYFPSRIVHRLGGETTLELTVTEFFQNPYVVFPTPEQLRRNSQ